MPLHSFELLDQNLSIRPLAFIVMIVSLPYIAVLLRLALHVVYRWHNKVTLMNSETTLLGRGGSSWKPNFDLRYGEILIPAQFVSRSRTSSIVRQPSFAYPIFFYPPGHGDDRDYRDGGACPSAGGGTSCGTKGKG